jgi:hypothetical protein
MANMKPIRITESKIDELARALEAVNGAAVEHVFFAKHLFPLKDDAERRLLLLLLKRDAVGARYRAISGHPVAGAYSYKRAATTVLLERRKTGWFLIEVEPIKLWPNQGGSRSLSLTEQQDRLAVAGFRSTYSVLRAEEAVGDLP